MMFRARINLLSVATAMSLALSTAGKAQLVSAPAPGRAADNKIYAQQLVNELLVANSDLLAVGLHAIPPGTEDYVIVAHSRDLIGKKDSEADVQMIVEDKTVIGREAAGYTTEPRMVVHSALRDCTGRVVGLAVLSFKLVGDTRKLAVHARAEAILSALAQKIPNAAALFKPIL